MKVSTDVESRFLVLPSLYLRQTNTLKGNISTNFAEYFTKSIFMKNYSYKIHSFRIKNFFPFLLLLLSLLSTFKIAEAHKLQVEPIIVVVRPQENFLTVEMRGNGEDIIQSIQVRDNERVGKGFVPAVSQRLQRYFDQKLNLKQGEKALQGQLIRLDYSRPDPLDYTTSNFSAILRYSRDPKLAIANPK